MRIRNLHFACFGLLAALLFCAVPSARAADTRPFQDLWIPPVLTGTEIDLTLSEKTNSFWAGSTTPTYGFNQAKFWGPTLILNQGETVQFKVKNDLTEPTTVHWHGLHLPPVMDGGPYQMIPAGETWTPSFTVKNNAGTYWYHPHPHGATQKQLTMGAGGLIIIRDVVEAALPLPRTYGVDDIPLVLTSRRFYPNQEFRFDGNNVKYGDYEFVNGTLDAQVRLPAQFVRLRILNAEIERGYNFGFSDGRVFHVIATDGGLVDKPIPMTRMMLMPGERVEVLVDLGADKTGSTLDLMTYNANQPFGFPGGESQRGGANGSLLNNLDYRLLRINVAAQTPKRITKLPEALVRNHFWTEADVNNRRTIRVTGTPPSDFAFDNSPFDMKSTSQVQIVKLGATEAWTIVNNNVFGHAFHIHDVQFTVISRSRGVVENYEHGWKDTVYVPNGQSVTFVAKFEDFASETDPFMFHCHMSNHEDAGMMGDFLVVKDPATIRKDALNFRARMEHPLTPELIAAAARQAQTQANAFSSTDLTGKSLSLASLTKNKPLVLFFIERDCPCSRDAAPFLDKLQTQYGEACTVVGVINANAELSGEWAKTVGVTFPIIADPDLKIIHSYHAKSSVYTTVVAPGGKIVKTYPGYSADMLKEISGTIARLSHVPERQFAVDAAPKQSVTGCFFADKESARPPVDSMSPPVPVTTVNPFVQFNATAPNVLLLVADDLGWNDVAFHQKNVPTPNLTKLAKDGLELGRFYACPVCSPTRAALLTGVMPRRLGIVDVVGPGQMLPTGLVTLPGTLKAAGYQTSLIGKWHLGQRSPPLANGFDHFYGFMGAEIDYFSHTRIHGSGVDWQRDGQTVNEEGYSTFLMTDDAIRQIKQRDQKRPFFLEVAFNAVHVPVKAPEEYIAKYRSLSANEATYFAAIDTLDVSIGRILDTLDQQGLRDNTLVVFLSDNGATRNNSPLRSGKGTVFEGGIRTPAVIRWPGHVPAGKTTQQPVCAHDLFPTIAAAVGVNVPTTAKLDGQNMWSSLRDGSVSSRHAFAIVAYDIALFDGDWKLIETQQGSRSLYHITTDISEASDEFAKQPAIAERLIAKLDELKKELPAAPVRRRGPGSGSALTQAPQAK